MGYWHAVTSPRLSSVAVGILLIFAVLVAQAQEPIALRSEPGGKGWKNVYGLCFSPDSRWLAAGMHDRIVVWDLASGKSVSFGQGPHQWLSVPAFSPDGRTLAVGTFSNPPPPCPSTILLFDVATGRQRDLLRSPRPGTAPWEIAFSPDGQYLAAGMLFEEVPVYLWSLSSSGATETTPVSPGSSP